MRLNAEKKRASGYETAALPGQLAPRTGHKRMSREELYFSFEPPPRMSADSLETFSTVVVCMVDPPLQQSSPACPEDLGDFSPYFISTSLVLTNGNQQPHAPYCLGQQHFRVLCQSERLHHLHRHCPLGCLHDQQLGLSSVDQLEHRYREH